VHQKTTNPVTALGKSYTPNTDGAAGGDGTVLSKRLPLAVSQRGETELII